MDTSKIAIQIASEFTGSKAFKQAESSTAKLQKTVSNLAKTLGLALGTAAIIKFGKASVKAFAADDNAARSLSKTLENLGISTRYAGSTLNGYISRLEKQTGVLDDELRPAMDRLLRATGSVTKSQELLGLALDISAGTGKDLTAVSQALQKAYLGNTQALGRLGVGLTKAELTTSSFTQIQDRLNILFAGQAVDAANSYQGSLNKLTIASNNAKEAIGQGLIDAILILSDSNTVDPAVSAIEKIAQKIADLTRGIARFIRLWKEMLTSFDIFIPKGGYGQKDTTFTQPMSIAGQTENALGLKQRKILESGLKTNKELLKNEKARLENLKKINAEQQKKLALDKASAFLFQAQKLFDMDRIQLAAAAMNKQTEEDKVRIRLKQEILDLEDAINQGNIEGAAKLATAISKDAELLGILRGDMIKLGDVPNPFAAWLATLQAIAAQLAALVQVPVPMVTGGYVPGTTPGQTGIPGMGGMASPGFGMGGWTQAIPPSYSPGDIPGLSGTRGFSLASVTVNVQGSVTTQQDLVTAITQGIYNNQASGIPINYSTVY